MSEFDPVDILYAIVFLGRFAIVFTFFYYIFKLIVTHP